MDTKKTSLWKGTILFFWGKSLPLTGNNFLSKEVISFDRKSYTLTWIISFGRKSFPLTGNHFLLQEMFSFDVISFPLRGSLCLYSLLETRDFYKIFRLNCKDFVGTRFLGSPGISYPAWHNPPHWGPRLLLDFSCLFDKI